MKKNINSAIAHAMCILKITAHARTTANRKFGSLSHVLKQVKKDSLWNAGVREAFAAVGIPDACIITPALLLNVADELCLVNEETGKKQLGVWGQTCMKDDNGMPVLDEHGKKTMRPQFRVIRAWSPNLVLKVLAQSAAFKQQNQ